MSHEYLFYTSCYNSMLFYLCCSNYVCVFSLFSDNIKCLRLIQYIFCLNLRIIHFSKESWSFFIGNSIRNQYVHPRIISCYQDVVASRPFQLTEQENIHIYEFPWELSIRVHFLLPLVIDSIHFESYLGQHHFSSPPSVRLFPTFVMQLDFFCHVLHSTLGFSYLNDFLNLCTLRFTLHSVGFDKSQCHVSNIAALYSIVSSP